MAGETLTGVFSDIADAIRAKGVSGQMKPTEMSTKITSIPSGGGETPEAEWKDVNFIDYDGKNLYSYTTAEALALTELPPAPDRTSKGLTFQEWNYTLAEVKANASDTGKCTAGATYTTTDGKTHIKITIQDEYYSNIPLVFKQTVSDGVEVDWGDGSTPETYSGTSQQTITHQYTPTSYPASYDITFKVNSGTMSFPANITGKSGSESSTNPTAAWNSMLKEVNFGNNITSIGNYVFSYYRCLTSVTISNSITSIGGEAFEGCISLKSVTIPKLITRIGYFSFQKCNGLTRVSMPYGFTNISEWLFDECYILNNISIPNSVTDIK